MANGNNAINVNNDVANVNNNGNNSKYNFNVCSSF